MGKDSKRLKVLDLFCGCGGLSFGFEQAGFECLLGVDHDQAALETFKLNHPNADSLNADLSSDKTIDLICDKIKGRTVDVIIAGPPCQGFSLTGTRVESDNRNKLFYSVFKLAKRVKPKVVIIENVPGIAHLYQGRARSAILDEFACLGLTPSEKLLFAPDYGVPQIRRRMVFVGTVGKYGKFNFPVPIKKPNKYVTCGEAIGDLPSREKEMGLEIDKYDKQPKSDYQKKMRRESDILYNHVATNHTEYVKSVIAQVPEGGNYRNLPPGVGESRLFHEAWTRYHSKRPSKTIDTGHRNHFHYKWNRIPTVRENARLQSFPDKFRFLGTRTQQNRQVGNAVPPLLGYHLGKAVIKQYEMMG